MVQVSVKDRSIQNKDKNLGIGKEIQYKGRRKKGEVIISLVERKTRYSIFVKVKGKDNESIKQGLREILKEYEKKGGSIQEYNTRQWE